MQYWEVSGLPVKHDLTFDDGTIMTSTRELTLYSWHYLQIFHGYPNTRILPKHHIRKVLKGEPLNESSHRKLCSAILKSICEDEGFTQPAQKEPILKRIFEQISASMNVMSEETAEDVISIDILDFIGIAKHPEICRYRDEVRENPKKIASAYSNSLKLIEHNPEFNNNGLAKAVRAKMVKVNQVMQCVLLRGYPTEVTGELFPKPILSNYTFGNTGFYEFNADSRTAAKSHFYSDTALKDSEYMARKFQLFASTVEHIVHEDCGSRDMISWLVGGPKYDSEGAEIYPGDLAFLIGKYYTTEKGGNPDKYIEGTEKELIGKQIWFRTPTKCHHHDPRAICHVCTGKLSENVSRFANVGHLGSVTSTKDVTQSILSIKHVNMSGTAVKILLAEHERTFFNTGIDGTAFYFNKNMIALKPEMYVSRDQVPGLAELSELEDLDSLSLQRMTQTSNIGIVTMFKGRRMEATMNVTQKMKPSMMSRDFLSYLKEYGWKTNENNDFVIDLSHWNTDKPMFVMPNKEESFVDMAEAVDKLVRSNQKLLDKRLNKDAPAILLHDLFEILNSKLRVNILALEIVVYSVMVESSTSYALSRNAKEPVLGLGNYLTYYRSMGPALAYENMDATLTDPINFFAGRRPDSPMDIFLTPKEVLENYPEPPLDTYLI